MRIVSGGQTGVDRAALDEAMALGLAVGGWCPRGRSAEDGVIPARYPLQEMPRAGYALRTRKNVEDSDGTLIVYYDYATGGTALTIKYAITAKRPFLLIDAAEMPVDRAAERLGRFIGDYNIGVLNVAGPRASGEPRAYAAVRRLIQLCFAPASRRDSHA
jgi:hypothetical protein